MSPLRDFGERRFVEAASLPVISRTMARLADARLPRPLLQRLMKTYIRAYKVDMAEVNDPLESFETFNAFFTRRLKPGARAVEAGEGVVVSPADSNVSSIGQIPESGRLDQIKGRSYSIEALLGSAADAEPFRRGVHATLYLSPAMYHRVHTPVDGRVRSWRYIPGRLFPVNTLAVKHVEGLFAVNERVNVRMDTDGFGPVAVVLVGAANVGRISLAFAPLMTNTGGAAALEEPAAPLALKRGDELGAFNLGSTVVLLVADASLVPAVAPGEFVRMGQALWRRS